MGQLAQEILAHKSYDTTDGGNIHKLIAMLAEEKKQQPSRMPYFFSASWKANIHPHFQPANKPKIEYLTLTPKGYRYRGLVYSDVNMIIKYFKERYQELPPHPVKPGQAQPTPTTFMIMTLDSMVGMQKPYTPSQSVHQWSTTPK